MNEQKNQNQAVDDPRAADNPNGEGALQDPELERLQNELSEARDRLLRSQAEFENFRKRSRREIEDERKYANVPLLRDLLPVVDNLDRAIEAAQSAADAGTLLGGVKMVRQQLEVVLGRHECQPIEALNEPFDPHLHEAITTQPSPQHPANTVLHVVQRGYQLHDRVIRPSQVIVSTRPEA